MVIKIFVFIALALVVTINQGCGVKGRPQPPLQEPYISTGSLTEDSQKKQKDKKKTFDQKTNEAQPNEP